MSRETSVVRFKGGFCVAAVIKWRKRGHINGMLSLSE
jgi:hypothetical protein